MSLTPDGIFPTYDALTPAFLRAVGIRALLLDVDNTLAPYEQSDPDERLVTWLLSLRAAGIRVAVASNNASGERVRRFCRDLPVDCFLRARKPFSGAFRQAMKKLNASPSETAALGDQVFTDVWAARNAHLARAWVVPPIRDKRDPFTRFKRLCERPFMRHCQKADVSSPQNDKETEKKTE